MTKIGTIYNLTYIRPPKKEKVAKSANEGTIYNLTYIGSPKKEKVAKPANGVKQSPPSNEAINLYKLKDKTIKTYYTLKRRLRSDVFNNNQFLNDYHHSINLNYKIIYNGNPIGIELGRLLDLYSKKQNEQNANALITYMNTTVIPDLQKRFDFRTYEAEAKAKAEAEAAEAKAKAEAEAAATKAKAEAAAAAEAEAAKAKAEAKAEAADATKAKAEAAAATKAKAAKAKAEAEAAATKAKAEAEAAADAAAKAKAAKAKVAEAKAKAEAEAAKAKAEAEAVELQNILKEIENESPYIENINIAKKIYTLNSEYEYFKNTTRLLSDSRLLSDNSQESINYVNTRILPSLINNNIISIKAIQVKTHPDTFSKFSNNLQKDKIDKLKTYITGANQIFNRWVDIVKVRGGKRKKTVVKSSKKPASKPTFTKLY